MFQMDNSRRIKQLLVVPNEIQRWFALLSPSEIHQVVFHLGPIRDFKDIESDGYLMEALEQLWDPCCLAFRIGNREMIVTIEEVAGLLNLSVYGTVVIFPFASGKIEVCHFTGLKDSIV